MNFRRLVGTEVLCTSIVTFLSRNRRGGYCWGQCASITSLRNQYVCPVAIVTAKYSASHIESATTDFLIELCSKNAYRNHPGRSETVRDTLMVTVVGKRAWPL